MEPLVRASPSLKPTLILSLHLSVYFSLSFSLSREPLRVIGSLERDSWIPRRVPMQRYKTRGISVIAERGTMPSRSSGPAVNGHCSAARS